MLKFSYLSGGLLIDLLLVMSQNNTTDRLTSRDVTVDNFFCLLTSRGKQSFTLLGYDHDEKGLL